MPAGREVPHERIAETERSITGIVESIEESETDQGVFEREYEDQSTITSGSPSPTDPAYSTTVSRCSDDLWPSERFIKTIIPRMPHSTEGVSATPTASGVSVSASSSSRSPVMSAKISSRYALNSSGFSLMGK